MYNSLNRRSPKKLYRRSPKKLSRRSPNRRSPKKLYRRSQRHRSPSLYSSQRINNLSKKYIGSGGESQFCQCFGDYFTGKRDKSNGEPCSCNYQCQSKWCRKGIWGCGGWFGADKQGSCVAPSNWNYLMY